MSWFRSLRDDFTLSPFENRGAQWVTYQLILLYFSVFFYFVFVLFRFLGGELGLGTSSDHWSIGAVITVIVFVRLVKQLWVFSVCFMVDSHTAATLVGFGRVWVIKVQSLWRNSGRIKEGLWTTVIIHTAFPYGLGKKRTKFGFKSDSFI